MVRATVTDVARLAGVSPTTVSNVVTATVPVSPKTRERVERALAELDYVPNLSARGLRNGRTGIVALALPDLSTAYAAEMAHHFVEVAGDRGRAIQIQETGNDSEREAQLLSRARVHLVDGLILNPVLLETSAVQPGVSLPPVVLIGEVDQPIADHVWIDNVQACRDMLDLLITRGHRRIAVLGAMRSETSRLRIRGYREALTEAGLPLDPDLEIDCLDWTARGAAECLGGFREQEITFDAVFCLTDTIALGALNALATAGLRVPEDVSVAGYDNVADSSFLVPPLTTVHFDKRQFAEQAVTLLQARIADRDRPIQSVVLPHSIMERASVRDRS